MNPENKKFLDDNRHHYEGFVKAQYLSHFDNATRDRLLQVVQQEFAPGYQANLWCSSCVADLLKFAYQRYDDWLSKNVGHENN